MSQSGGVSTNPCVLCHAPAVGNAEGNYASSVACMGGCPPDVFLKEDLENENETGTETWNVESHP